MKKLISLLCLLVSTAAIAQMAPIPAPNDILGRPFAIRNKWVIGGNGTWDYLTLDPAARQLFITHQSQVQVVDIGTGQVLGQVSGLGDARQVVLDPDRPFAYVSDGFRNQVISFDRRAFRIVLTSSPLRASPRALVLEPQTGLLFAFGSKTTEAYAQEYGPRIRAKVPIDDPCAQRGSHPDSVSQSIITILDPENMWKLAEIQLCGTLGSAVADGEGQIYFVIENHNDIARFNASVLADEIRTTNHSAATRPHATSTPDQPAQVDLRSGFSLPEYQEFRINHNYRDGCSDLHALAVDTARQRLFAACANQRFEVMSTDRAQPIASLVIGPGVDAIAYDPGRNLIFTANGGGYGSVTVIRQTLNDDYTVVQNLPTMERARTMALDPSSGILYLVTDLHGADLRNTPANGIGKLTLKQVDNSFQVLVVGN